MKYKENGQWKDITVKVTDTLPVGSEVDYSGSTVPSGWEEISDLNTKAGSTETTELDDVGSNGKLNKSGLYSSNVNGTWYNLINIRHRNGYGDGVSYGMQIRSHLTSQPMFEIRNQYGGSTRWTKWKDISNTYSTEETCIGTWTNGKPLYRKVINFDTIHSSSTNIYDVSSLNIDTLIKQDMIFKHGPNIENQNYYISDSDMARLWYCEGSLKFSFKVSESSNRALSVTIEYTKTTD